MLELLLSVFYAFLSSLAFSMVFEVHGKTCFSTAIGGGIAWLIYRLVSMMHSNYLLPYFIATLGAAVFSELMARIKKKPATVYLVVAMLPLVPGQGIYESMYAFAMGDNQKGIELSTQTLAISGSLALGILLTSTAIKIFQQIFFHDKSKKLERI